MKISQILCCLALFAGIVSVSAGPLKIAVIDMQHVFQNYEKTKTIEMKLNQQMEIFKDYSKQLAGQYTDLKKQFEDLRDAALNIALSEAERENRRLAAQDKYRTMERKKAELEKYNRSRQAQIKETYEKMRLEILGEIQKAVHRKAVLEGYTLVLDKSGASLNDISTIVYYTPDLEITDAVLKDLNRGNRTGTSRSNPTKK